MKKSIGMFWRRNGIQGKVGGKVPYQTIYLGDKVFPGKFDTKQMFYSMDLASDVYGKTFLDLGCNVGGLVFLAEEFGAAQAVGVDCNEQWIKYARELARRENRSSIFYCQNIFNYVSEMNPVDIVVCTAVFRHLYAELMQKYVRGFKKPKGYLTYNSMDVLIRQNVGGPEAVVNEYNAIVACMLEKTNKRFICSYNDRSGVILRRKVEVLEYFQRLSNRVVDLELYIYDYNNPKFIITDIILAERATDQSKC